ncbi:MAG: 50S ribosomal protein L29 [Lentisphaerae bacterium]|nr:50S ribosomal protein L29 [Lentisphaerota bacterium]
MKAKELRELSLEEINQRYREAVKESFDLRMKRATGKTENPLRVRLLRRDMARMKTILTERGKAAAAPRSTGK